MVWIKSLGTGAWCPFCSGSRNSGTNCAITHVKPRSWIKISDAVVFGIPRSASSSHTVSCWSLLIATHILSTFSGVLLVAGLSEYGSLSTDSRPQVANTRLLGQIWPSTLFYLAWHLVSTWWQRRAPCPYLRSSYIYTDLKLHVALWRQLWGWCGPQWKWVWHPWSRT